MCLFTHSSWFTAVLKWQEFVLIIDKRMRHFPSCFPKIVQLRTVHFTCAARVKNVLTAPHLLPSPNCPRLTFAHCRLARTQTPPFSPLPPTDRSFVTPVTIILQILNGVLAAILPKTTSARFCLPRSKTVATYKCHF